MHHAEHHAGVSAGKPSKGSARGCLQEASLSLAFDYAEHDLYEMIRFHRERAASVPALSAYTVKSLVWQMLQVVPGARPAGLDAGFLFFPDVRAKMLPVAVPASCLCLS